MEHQMEGIPRQLAAHRYKLTTQREATVRVLLENRQEHLSAEDVYLLVKKEAPEIGLATVYRTLELLIDLKILHKLNFGDGVTRYEFQDENAAHQHHHLLCLCCGCVDPITEDLLEGPVEEYVEKHYHFQIADHQLTFQGFCSSCQDKKKEAVSSDSEGKNLESESDPGLLEEMATKGKGASSVVSKKGGKDL